MPKRKIYEISNDCEFLIKNMFEELITTNKVETIKTLNFETIIYVIKMLNENFLQSMLLKMIKNILEFTMLNESDELLKTLMLMCDEEEILKDMIFLLKQYLKKNKLICCISGCLMDAKYNFSGFGDPTHCCRHKEIKMISTKIDFQPKTNYKCIYNCCDNRAKFNYPNEKVKIYCSTHKLPNMIKI